MEPLVTFVVSALILGGLVRGALYVGDKTAGSPASSNRDFGKLALLIFAGCLVGGLIGFLLRPSAPLVGQLDFGTVVTRGGRLQGLDQLLVSTAQTSFNYLLAGALLGGVIGGALGYFLTRMKESEARTTASP
jgi:hypothetical protein